MRASDLFQTIIVKIRKGAAALTRVLRAAIAKEISNAGFPLMTIVLSKQCR